MSASVVPTADGSCTLYSERCGDHYHSLYGAITESDWVYIREGLLKFPSNTPVCILEVGWGTGLNSVLARRQVHVGSRKIKIDALEPFPPDFKTIESWLQHCEHLNEEEKTVLSLMHRNAFFEEPDFFLKVHKMELLSYHALPCYNLVFYDAFAPSRQPEMWDSACFKHIAEMMMPGGMLVTYCAQGLFRRTLKQIGFTVEKVPGPPGKREITRAIKTNSFPLSH